MEPFPHQLTIEAFLLCTEEVPSSAYADFLDANPQWRGEQREELEKQGLVNSDYLIDYGVTTGVRMNAGISSVSWFSAQAFCRWLTGKLPDSFAGWEVRLPTEAEWEYAAKSGQNRGSGFFANEGLWEWCAGPYSHFPYLLPAPHSAVAAVGSPERPVRGGSWLNVYTVTAETRGSLPPDTCSAFVSFRPVIARVNPPPL